MNTVNWKQKLSSRKFWAAVAGLVTAILTAVGCADNTVVQVAAIISALGVVIAYICAEAYVDANRSYTDTDETSNTDETSDTEK